MPRDYTKYTVEGLGENLNKRQIGFNTINSWARKNKGVVKFINILIFSITILEPTYSQVNLTVSDYSFEKFEEYGLDFEPVKQKYLKTNIESCQLNEEDKLRFNEKISSTISLWNSVHVLKKLKESKMVYGEEFKRPISEEEIVSLENLNELLAKRNQHTLMSLVVTEKKDTLLLFFIARSLVCKNINEINQLYEKWSMINENKEVVIFDSINKIEKQIPLYTNPVSRFDKDYEKTKKYIQELSDQLTVPMNKTSHIYEYYVKQEIPKNYSADIIFGFASGDFYKPVLGIDSNKIIVDNKEHLDGLDNYGRSFSIEGEKYYSIFNSIDSSFIGLLFYGQGLGKLWFLDAELSKQKRTQAIKLKEDVVILKKHISDLKETVLELTNAEKVELNTNIQTRIIKAIDSLKLPKYYLVSVNRTEPAAQTKSYFYIVEKHSNNRFYSLGKEHDDFPLMDTVLNSQILIDTIQLSINKDEMKKTVNSTDYTAHFSDYFDSGMRYDGKTQYSRGLGGPILNSSDTLFMTTSDGGAYSNMRNPLYLDNFPTYQEFSQKYLLDVRGKDFPLSKLESRGYSIVENHIYSKDSISFAINIKKGQNSEPINSSYGGTVYGSNKKEIYDYAEQFHKFYKGWKQEVEEEKQKKELAAEQEKEQEKQELAKKYGRKYVDAMYELKIIVGMPEDLVNVIVNKLYTVGTSSSSNNGNYYRLEPRYGTGWVSVWIKNKKVTSVTYH